eukprot:6187726-Pleurochrysis_carterae.AAC.2
MTHSPALSLFNALAFTPSISISRALCKTLAPSPPRLVSPPDIEAQSNATRHQECSERLVPAHCAACCPKASDASRPPSRTETGADRALAIVSSEAQSISSTLKGGAHAHAHAHAGAQPGAHPVSYAGAYAGANASSSAPAIRPTLGLSDENCVSRAEWAGTAFVAAATAAAAAAASGTAGTGVAAVTAVSA